MPCHVLVVGNRTLFDEGLTGLLAQEGGLRISGIAYKDKATFLREIARVQPDAILMNEIGMANPGQICEWLKESPVPETVRVIIVRADDNRVEVYEKRTITVAHRADLISLIRGSARGS